MVNGHPTSKINIERGVRQGCPFSMTLFVLSTIPLINMIKADKRITGHITKHVHPVKIQSYADDTMIIINQQNEIKYIYEIFNKHSQASEAAINMEKKPKYSDLVIDMFRQNQSMTSSPKKLKTRLLSWGQSSAGTNIWRLLKTCRRLITPSKRQKIIIVMVILSVLWGKYCSGTYTIQCGTMHG